MTEIKEFIRKKGTSVAEVCRKMNIDRANFYKATKSPTRAMLQRIADTLEISYSELCAELDKKEEDNNDFCAIVTHKGRGYKAESLQKLKELIKKIERSM